MKLSVLLHRIKHYIHHLWKAQTIYSIHSPFLYEFVKECFDKNNHYYFFDEANNIRKKIETSNHKIRYENIGSTSMHLKDKEVSVKEILKTAVTPKELSEIYFRIIVFLKCRNILELGTSLGVNTMYLAHATKGKVISIEGQKALFDFASQLFNQYQIKNVELINQHFDNILPELVNQNTFDFVLIDGNHTYDATLRYFELLKNKMSDKSVMIIDDIYWNKAMTAAWKNIIQSNEISASIDLFRCGILIFNNDIKTKYRLQLRINITK